MGPGFDCIGVCLSMENTVTFTARRKDAVINGVRDRAKNDSHLIVRSLYCALDKLKAPRPEGYEIQLRSQVPISRGLGSSACCIGAGVALAYLYTGQKIDRERLFATACEIEGHPDNVAPNIFGGAVLSYQTESGYKAMRFSIDRKFRFIAMIPNFKLSTKSARKALPGHYSRADAVYNISHAALLTAALAKGNSRHLAEALDDRLHQPYRAPLIAGYEDARRLAMESGAIGTYISGAGPTIMAIADSADCFYAIKSRLKRELRGWQARPLRISSEGLRFSVT
jgi:homoserine kinase